ncbi:MAG TPA: dephospho-CoA kinase [Gammaproteobacteria bacterium]|nr:dephospho-CoA kinase [Gammaproteobacteria bacterium]
MRPAPARIRHRPFRVGLTGGIASGKSTVAAQFAALGIPVIDADVLAREVTQPGQPALARLVERFGREILDAQGTLDRRRFRERLFQDPEARRAAEAILHPPIVAALEHQADAATAPYVVLVVPLLLEGNYSTLVDRVLVVDCAEETQLARLMRRDGETLEVARRMLAAQLPRAARLTLADDVIANEGDPGMLRQEVERLHRYYLTLAAQEKLEKT